MDEIRNQLKTMNRQFDFYMKHKTAMKNNLIGLLDQTYPGVNTYFDSPARPDGHQKWVDFASTYWHVDCVRKMSLNAFTDHYQKWCSRKGYNFCKAKAEEIYGATKELMPVLPKDDFTKRIIKQAAGQLYAASQTVGDSVPSSGFERQPTFRIPDCHGNERSWPFSGSSTDSRDRGCGTVPLIEMLLLHLPALTPVSMSLETTPQKSVHASKHGSPALRKTLFQVMDVLIKTKPQDDPVYLFMDKKRAQGKPYYVYMTAGANKFLRIYYGRVKEYLASLPQ